ncbi:MAG: PhzF family phenazine biosynthesis isomerase [Gluconobacter japonicus]|uniref:PhzF family phenazine biosynthesis protein n=1 Tax=Gluconobacter japonicus TaxID=376620 RepID=UPI0039E9B4FE
MRRSYVTLDVFTDQLFGGNPLAVVLDAAGLSTEQMQKIAIEFGYSETTFVLPAVEADHTAHVRIFTPGGRASIRRSSEYRHGFRFGQTGRSAGTGTAGNAFV